MNEFKYSCGPVLRKKQKRAGGGILLCFKNNFEIVTVASSAKNWIIVKLKDKTHNESLIETCVYIPPSSKNDHIFIYHGRIKYFHWSIFGHFYKMPWLYTQTSYNRWTILSSLFSMKMYIFWLKHCLIYKTHIIENRFCR